MKGKPRTIPVFFYVSTRSRCRRAVLRLCFPFSSCSFLKLFRRDLAVSFEKTKRKFEFYRVFVTIKLVGGRGAGGTRARGECANDRIARDAFRAAGSAVAGRRRRSLRHEFARGGGERPAVRERARLVRSGGRHRRTARLPRFRGCVCRCLCSYCSPSVVFFKFCQ